MGPIEVELVNTKKIEFVSKVEERETCAGQGNRVVPIVRLSGTDFEGRTLAEIKAMTRFEWSGPNSFVPVEVAPEVYNEGDHLYALEAVTLPTFVGADGKAIGTTYTLTVTTLTSVGGLQVEECEATQTYNVTGLSRIDFDIEVDNA